MAEEGGSTPQGGWAAPEGPGAPYQGPSQTPYQGPGQAPYQGPSQAAPPSAGWVPPPRPGLLPLRPLGFGTILGAPYRALRQNPRPTFGTALLLQLGVALVTALVVGTTAWATFSRVPFANGAEEEERLIAGGIAATLLSSALPIGLSVFALGVMQGIVVLEIARQTVGERLRLGQLWRRARGRLAAVGGWSLLVTVVSAVPVVLVAGMVVGAVALLGPVGIAIAVLVAILGALAVAAASAWLFTKLAFVPTVIVLERGSIRHAMARSWRLTTGSFWRILGTLLLVGAILTTATQVVATPFQFFGGIVVGLLAPTGDPTTAIGATILLYIVVIAISLVMSGITLVVQSGTTALLYIDQRMRLEGLDLELARFVEAGPESRHLPDPFETVPPPAPSSPPPA